MTEPSCRACGKPFTGHLSVQAACERLQEMRAENARLTTTTIKLTDDVRQDDKEGPPAFLVFCHERDAVMEDFKVFTSQREAMNYAQRCEEEHPDRGDWPVYPLWAGHERPRNHQSPETTR